jgi:adenylosuccinate lyase
MEATARMKEGGDCDLLSRLAAARAFGLTEEEMTALLEPRRYIGRCPAQVTAFLEAHRAELRGVERAAGGIEV